jgi:hypothetical protein
VIDQNSLSPERKACREAVVRLPVRLYESKGAIFELYDGGQPHRPTTIRWQRIESIEGMDSQPPEFHRRLEDKQ